MTATYPDLAGKVVLVTGGASGIGAAMVRAFAGQGSRVAFLDLAAKAGTALAAELTAAGGSALFQQADLTDIDALRAGFAAVQGALGGPVDVLVNNAANDERHRVEEVTPEYFDGRVAVNLRHQFFAAQAVLPGMAARGSGSVINFGSISWMLKEPELAVYTACKSAVLGMTRSLARAYGASGVRVNCIAPGWIMTERQLALWVTPESERAMLEGQCLKRRLLPDEVARVALFLASDDASACTAQQFIVDGGWI